MSHVIEASLNTVRLGSARAVLAAWIVLAVAATVVLGALLLGDPPSAASAVQSSCRTLTSGLRCAAVAPLPR